MPAIRSSLNITLAVWRALFLREALGRFTEHRAAWVWLLLEPIMHIAFLVFIFTMVRARTVGNIDFVVWIIVGLLTFFMFRRTAMHAMKAVGASSALFAYRQIKPVDTVLVRGALEGFLMIIMTLLVISGAGFLGFTVLPSDPLAILEAMFGAWLLAIGFGLIVSVATNLIPELGRVIKVLMMPLYMISGVVFPIAAIPEAYRGWLLLNPIAHALEAARLGFSPHYHAVPELSIAYIYAIALPMVFLGLALHARFASRLVAS